MATEDIAGRLTKQLFGVCDAIYTCVHVYLHRLCSTSDCKLQCADHGTSCALDKLSNEMTISFFSRSTALFLLSIGLVHFFSKTSHSILSLFSFSMLLFFSASNCCKKI